MAAASARSKAKPKRKDVEGKQATLLGMNKAMPPPRTVEPESAGPMETDGVLDETLRDETPVEILEESQVSRVLDLDAKTPMECSGPGNNRINRRYLTDLGHSLPYWHLQMPGRS